MPPTRNNWDDADALARYQGLDWMERQILGYYVAGHSSQVIIDHFDICEITTEAYRARLMRKMLAGNLIELLVRARICTLALTDMGGEGTRERRRNAGRMLPRGDIWA